MFSVGVEDAKLRVWMYWCQGTCWMNLKMKGLEMRIWNGRKARVNEGLSISTEEGWTILKMLMNKS